MLIGVVACLGSGVKLCSVSLIFGGVLVLLMFTAVVVTLMFIGVVATLIFTGVIVTLMFSCVVATLIFTGVVVFLVFTDVPLLFTGVVVSLIFTYVFGSCWNRVRSWSKCGAGEKHAFGLRVSWFLALSTNVTKGAWRFCTKPGVVISKTYAV